MAHSPGSGGTVETKSRNFSGRFWSLLLVGVLFLLVASYLTPSVQSHSMAPGAVAPPKGSPVLASSLHAPTPAIVRAAAGFPVIISYVASPATITETQSTTFVVTASASSGTLPFTYIYANLPPGCVTANTSSLSCLPTANGTFKVQAQVKDVHGNSTFANTTLTVLRITLGSFLEFNTSLSNPVQSNRLCTLTNASPFYTTYCYQQAQQPTVLSFGNGNVGVGFQVYTHQTTNTCTGASSATTSRVEFALSSNDGSAYTSTANIGNTTCTYLNAMEPSFVLSTGVVYGVFVEENQTSAQLPVSYSNRTGDAMGFVSATSNGTVWSAVRTLPLGSQIAQPRLVATGHTLYLVWERLANSTTPIGGGVQPIAVEFSASFNGGLTWSVPVTLRGLNATAGYNAMSPSIAVTPTGELVVVYATNRSCVSIAKSGCAAYGESIVSVNSTNNGTLWGSLHVIAKGIGESTCYSSGCLSSSSFYQSTPETTVAAAADGSVSVAYAGTVPLNPFNPLLNYRWTGLFYGASSNGGGSWTTMKVRGWGFGTSTNFFNPAIGTSNGTAYLTYTEDNETLGTYWLDSSMSQWLITTPTGTSLNLAPPYMVEISKLPSGRLTNYTRNSYSGLSAAVGFDEVTATPIVAYALAQTPAVRISHGPGYYYTNNTYSTNLTVAFEGPRGVSPQTVSLLFTQTGLSSAFNWSVSVNGLSFTTNTSQIFIPNVPRNQLLIVLQNPLGGAGWIQQTSTITEQGLLLFVANTTIVLSFTLLFGYAWYPSVATWPTVTSSSGGYKFIEIAQSNYTYNYPYYYIDEFNFFDVYASGGYGSLEYYHYYYYYNYQTYQSQYNYAYSYCSYSPSSGGYSGPPCNPRPSYSYPPGTPYPFPFYFPYGENFPLQVYCEGLQSAPSYTNGTGIGAYNGGFFNTYGSCGSYGQYQTGNGSAGSGIIHVKSVGNQTVYFGGTTASGTYNETIQPVGLPSGTPYHFTWAGTPYSAKSPATVQIGPLGLGSYSVTSIWANGSKPGWEYFGHLDSGTRVLVPWQPVVNLTFSANVNLSSPFKSVTFNGVNLTAGVQWRLVFNETSYAASTPSITVSTRSGTFPISSGAAVGPSGDTGYVPNIPASVDLTGSAKQVNLSFVPAYRVNFTASIGGTVSVGSSPPSSSFQYWAVVGQTFSFSAHPDPGFAFVTWTGTGSGSYTGTNATTTAKANAPIEEAAEFEQLPGARFSLTFQENGLPPGTQWGVVLNGVGYSSNANQLTVSNLYAWSGTTTTGHYSLVVPPSYANSTSQAKFIASGAPTVVGTNGSTTPPQTLTFLSEFAVSVVSTQGGSAKAVLGSVAGTTIWAPNGSTVSLQETPVPGTPGFHFLGWNGTGPGSYSGVLKNPNVRVSGAPIRELAVFAKNPVIPPKTYNATFNVSTPLEAGTVWSIQVAGVGYTALAGTPINVTGLLPGVYPVLLYPMYGPAGLTEYLPAAGDPSAVSIVAGPVLVSLQYQTYYYVSITTSTGGTVSPASGWVPSGSSFTLGAVPIGTNTFTHWVGTGSGSFSGKTTVGTVHVNGPITEVAEFSPAVPPAIQVTSIWTSPALLGGLAAAGLVAGLGIGLLVARSGRRSASGGEGSA